jgi:predicted nuclease of predicted toxin-antitoxin system
VKIKLLLDVHISPEVAAALRRRFVNLDVKSIHETDWAALPDPVLLELLDEENRVLVTRDVNTVPLHCKNRIASGKTFAGVIYADSKKLRQTDQKGLIRRLVQVVENHGNEDFRCRSGWL